MKRNNNTRKKENTLFTYFSKLSTKIEIEETIDLTEDDNDCIEIPSTPTPENSQILSQSLSDSQSSFGSSSKRQRANNEVITNTSKYNNRKWLEDSKDVKPLSSSQEPSFISSQGRKNTQRHDRIVLKKPVISSEPAYDWLTNDDVKPYSSGYNPYTYVDPIKKPEIIVSNANANATQKRRGNDNRGSWNDSSSYNSTSDASSRRKLPWNDSSSYSSIPDASSQRKQPWNSRENEDTAKFWNDSFANKKKKTIHHADRTLGSFAQKTSNYSIGHSNEYRPDLSDEQKRVLDMVMNEKKSIFFTGSAGTGKSVLLRAIIDQLGQRYGSQLAVTASTGIAACNINGCTLHSFGGIGLGKDSGADLARNIRDNNRKARDRWQNTKVLVIDEISMVDAELFDKLDEIARTIRNNQSPFGGMQVIVTGDFFQLPPVNPNKVSRFAFEAKTWANVIQKTVMLTQVFRQKDGTFVEILNEMRLGRLSESAIRKFRSLSRKPEGNDGIEPTELYPLRNEVDESNRRRLEALTGDAIEFQAIDSGDSRKMQSCLASQVIRLKEHAQVMLLKNMDADLVNGSIGVVVGFVGKGKYRKKETVARLRTPNRIKDSFIDDSGDIDMKTPYPVVKFSGDRILVLEREVWSVELPGGKEAASRSQIPLMLAWAISIHKSQGQTLDRVKVDLGKVFEKGQAYVALSRATSLDRLQILNFDPKRVQAHPTVTQFYSSLKTV